MLPATVIYTCAGAQLKNLNHISDAMSLNSLIALTLFSLLPFLLRFLIFLLLDKRNIFTK